MWLLFSKDPSSNCAEGYYNMQIARGVLVS